MNVLITGATGQIGSALTKILNSCNLILSSRDESRLRKEYATQNHIRILNNSELLKKINPHEIDVCIHSAFSLTNNNDELRSSLDFTKLLCNFAVANKKLRFIYISSQSVYGDNYELSANEDTPCHPSSQYAKAKLEGENICRQYYPDFSKLYIIRLSSVLNEKRYINKMVKQALYQHSISITSGESIISLIHINDVIEALKAVIFNTSAPGGYYNLAPTNFTFNIMNIGLRIKEILATLNIKTELNITDEGILRNSVMCNEKFRQTFAWNPIYDIDKMIIECIKL